jgi:hypothetical protein
MWSDCACSINSGECADTGCSMLPTSGKSAIGLYILPLVQTQELAMLPKYGQSAEGL